MGWRQSGGARGLLRGASVAFSRAYYTIQAVPREHTGRRLLARERELGRIPAVVTSQGDGDGADDPRKLLITADKKQIITLLKRVPFFCSTTFVLQVRAGPGSSVLLQSGSVLPIKIQKNAETGEVLNMVLAWAEKEDSLKVNVPVVYKGENECPGLKKGGYLQKMRPSIRYLCPSEHIPASVEVDVSKLDIGDRVHLQDLQIHPSLKLLSKNKTMPVCELTASKPEHHTTAKADPIDRDAEST